MANWFATVAQLIIGRNVAGRSRRFDSVSDMLLRDGRKVQRMPEGSCITRRDITEPTVWHYDGETAGWLSHSGRYYLGVSDTSLSLSLYSPSHEEGHLPFYTYSAEQGQRSHSILGSGAFPLVMDKTSRLDMVQVSLAWAIGFGRWGHGTVSLNTASDNPETRQMLLLTNLHMLMHCERVMKERLEILSGDGSTKVLSDKSRLLQEQLRSTRRLYFRSVSKDGPVLQGMVKDMFLDAVHENAKRPKLMPYGSAPVPHWFYGYLNEADREILFGK